MYRQIGRKWLARQTRHDEVKMKFLLTLKSIQSDDHDDSSSELRCCCTAAFSCKNCIIPLSSSSAKNQTIKNPGTYSSLLWHTEREILWCIYKRRRVSARVRVLLLPQLLLLPSHHPKNSLSDHSIFHNKYAYCCKIILPAAPPVQEGEDDDITLVSLKTIHVYLQMYPYIKMNKMSNNFVVNFWGSNQTTRRRRSTHSTLI